MEALFIYIIKSSSLMLLFYCAYYFLLRKETFFNSNRWFLLSGLIVSAILPLVTYTKVIWINAAPQFDTDFQNFVSNTSQDESSEFNWNFFLLGIYALGLLIFLIKLAIDFYSLNSIIKGKKIKQQADFKFIDINENIAPFSYFEYIVYNSSLYTASELENIIEHEKVHSDQNHTFDVLISRIFSIIFWFNPIVWFYKKAITQNLEFIADSEAAKKLLDKKAYQYTLLKITTHENCVAITNHFYQSLIKKRIVMLNKNQSNKRNSWKYYAVIPALAAFVLLFQIEVIAKERPQTVKSASTEIEAVDVYTIQKNTTDLELKRIKTQLKMLHNVEFEASRVKRNSANQLTSLKVEIAYENQKSQSIQTGGKVAIKDFGIVVVTGKNGAKRTGIKTYDEKSAVSQKVALNEKANNSEVKNTITNTETHVNTNSITSTKTDSNTNSNISTTVIINKDNNTKVITTGGTTVAVSNGTKTNVKASSPLVIVDGEEMPSGFDYNSIKPKDIESVNVLNGVNATEQYGDKASNGVIEIVTKK
ncbi:MAG: M56 family metallopeptidase [Flavobacterium nitrogenifigens]|uniref:TonB-dependent Receptor Plug Domain n=1 Tax=Flavobacterium nitrogenifigens TaxID=1617283 RepID=A0A521BTI3_9FLAO|nr:M56 family metallopeptidase [Flavobacterium nitrogenifigens]KAF2337643.1 TonB-dependent receptor plug domain-containing protein [Flavobacterium nitrogenifigens]MDQ8013595.1 M56 family metallopeptidase [Flavobacterium nitrogenifigens]SMO50021.1 TonB-dependent Receptor Plug Domain [Flavobacterium nitrogenifigens]